MTDWIFLVSVPQALQCFQEAATEVEKEEFLLRLTGSEEEESASTPRLQYYNKVHLYHEKIPVLQKDTWSTCPVQGCCDSLQTCHIFDN